MTEGRINIIDATPVEAAQLGRGKDANDEPTRDPEAGWHVKADSRGNMKSNYGYSIHTGVDEDGFIHRQTVTPENAHDTPNGTHFCCVFLAEPHAVSWKGLALMIKCSAKDIGATLFQTLTGCETTQSL